MSCANALFKFFKSIFIKNWTFKTFKSKNRRGRKKICRVFLDFRSKPEPPSSQTAPRSWSRTKIKRLRNADFNYSIIPANKKKIHTYKKLIQFQQKYESLHIYIYVYHYNDCYFFKRITFLHVSVAPQVLTVSFVVYFCGNAIIL